MQVPLNRDARLVDASFDEVELDTVLDTGPTWSLPAR
jgi:hypothetical protein